MIDYHLHTARCRHAHGAMKEYLAEARRKGLVEIGFADHFPLGLLGFTPRVVVTMEPAELAEYVADVRELAASSGGIAVKLGVEVDYLPGKAGNLASLLAAHPFDYVIGSVHFIDDWDFSHPSYAERYRTLDLSRVYRRYFELVWEACASGLFDIIGHVDVIKKFGFQPAEDLEPYWRETARVLRETGTCLELNTSGRDAPVGEFYPAAPFLEICREAGVVVTMGSDAHGAGQVGRYFAEGAALLRAAGYRELAVFAARRQSLVPLEGEQ
jgi:histidinol-phosphatase (PHP family)